MLVTKLEDYGKKKQKVYIDDEYAFCLYQNEIISYGIEDNAEISKEILDDIYKNIILVRAKKYALHLLERMDYTEYELRKKLKSACYSEKAEEEAVAYVKKYSYINDQQYAVSYIKRYMQVKSKLYIQNKLFEKGIENQIINNAFSLCEREAKDSNDLSPEIIALRHEINKKMKNIQVMTMKDKQKIFSALCRKGFEYEMIQRELELTDLHYDKTEDSF